MKKNAFQETILQSGDDIAALFSEQFDTELGQRITASCVEHESGLGWTCLLQDENLNEVQAHDFNSREELEEWLAQQGVAVEE